MCLENKSLSIYIYDFFTRAVTFGKSEENIEKSMLLYDKMGFTINLKKSHYFSSKEFFLEFRKIEITIYHICQLKSWDLCSIKFLKINNDELDATLNLSVEAKQELEWWLHNVQKFGKPISVSCIGIECYYQSSCFYVVHILFTRKLWEPGYN